MQENEFEKQVKHLMDDFKVDPPGEAWEGISRTLNNNRRRRLPFIFLMVIPLVITGFFIFYKQGNESSSVKVVTSTDNNSILKDSAASKIVLQKDSVIVNSKPVVAANSNEVKDNNFRNKTAVNDQYATLQPTTSLKDLTSIENNSRNITVPANQTPVVANTTTAYNKPGIEDSVNNTAITVQPANPILNTGNIIAAISTLNKTDSVAATAKNETVKTDNANALKTVAINKKASKWKWGINTFYGRNDAVEGLTEAKATTAQDFTLNSPTSIIAGDTVFNKYPYTTSNAYSVGFDVQRSISKNIVVGTGLSFTHLSTKSDVRQKIDTSYSVGLSNLAVNSYYQPGIYTSYTNNYNFIELPVYLQQNLLQKKQFSFGYNAGFSVRQLISTDALIYNNYSNIYFSKDALLRKTQFQAFAGLNFGFNTGKSSSVYIGPQVSYSLSNFMKHSEDGNYHFITYGLKAGLLMHKK